MRVLKPGDQFVDGARDVFMRGETWENMDVGEETVSLSLANMTCVGTPDIKTAVVFWGASDVPSL